MGLFKQIRGVATSAAIFSVVTLTAAYAQSPAEFYRGKTIELDIGYSAGGAYDVYARTLARHIGKHIPGNPTVVPKNVEGAGSLRLANTLYNAAPKDGTVIGTIGRGTGLDPLFGNKGAQFDGNKFNWIGSANNEVSICLAWHTTGIKTFEDVLTKELVVGASSPSADTYQFPKVINGVFGTKFKIVTGYPGGNDIGLALERGEVFGRCAFSWSGVKATHQDWLDAKKINILFQMGLARHSELPQVPLILDFAKTEEQKSILTLVFARQVMAWPYLAPPGVPQDRVAILRKAFMDTFRDKEFLADAEKAKLEIAPVPGEQIQALVHQIYATPAEITQKTAALIQ
jgi:tripartite-type tricarboxylate transporter receptor subunit TctC